MCLCGYLLEPFQGFNYFIRLEIYLLISFPLSSINRSKLLSYIMIFVIDVIFVTRRPLLTQYIQFEKNTCSTHLGHVQLFSNSIKVQRSNLCSTDIFKPFSRIYNCFSYFSREQLPLLFSHLSFTIDLRRNC